mgnify:CR=1 FL=1
MWANPYAVKPPSTERVKKPDERKAKRAEINRERVNKLKEEREFLKGIKHAHSLEQLDHIRVKIKEDEENRFLQLQSARSQQQSARSHHSDHQDVDGAARYRTIAKLPGTAVRAIEPTQGGSTLWTAEEDGTVGIRNGQSGALVYTIERAADGVTVEVLHSAGNLMWVGLSNGGIRIYDQVVYILSFEAARHAQSVTAFAPTFDAKMFSASMDGSVVKWDSEAREYALLGELRDTAFAARSLVCYGYHLFVGFDSALVRSFDAETLAPIKEFRGHTNIISSLAVLDGFLCSGSDDGTVRVWDIQEAVEVQLLSGSASSVAGATSAGVTTLMVDDKGHRLWAADKEGAVFVYDCPIASPITLLCSTPPSGEPVVTLKGFAAYDAITLWSLGSNGINYIWTSTKNHAEDAVRQSIAAMDHIIEQDQKELARWHELIRTLLAVAERLRRTASRQLEEGNGQIHRGAVFGQWHSWTLHRQFSAQRQRFCAALEKRTSHQTLSQYLHKWATSLQAGKRRRQRLAATAVMQSTAQGIAVLQQFHKLQAFYRHMRRLAVRREQAQSAAGHAGRRLLGRYFRVLLAFRDECIAKRHARRRAEVMERWSLNTVVKQTFARWTKATAKMKGRVRRQAVAQALHGQSGRDTYLRYYCRWLRLLSARRVARMAIKQLQYVTESTNALLISSYFAKWTKYSADRIDERRRSDIAQGTSRAAILQTDVDKVQHLLRRRELVDAAQALIDKARADLQRKLLKRTQIEEDCCELRDAIAAKREAATARAKTLSEQVDDLIATLKSRVLNLHQDYVFICKTTEKSKSIAASKMFLEAHLAVKRIVVQLTRQVHLLPSQVWPLTYSGIRKMPGHAVESVLAALKAMIVTFDVMTPDDRAALMTDEEISLNAHWLLAIADHCVAMRLKKLGASAFRVK